MYVMIVLLLGSALVGFTGRLSMKAQTGLALLAATVATLIYYFSQAAMG